MKTIASLAWFAGACALAFAQQQGPAASPVIVGTYQLVSRQLPDGRMIHPPAIVGLYSISPTTINFNIVEKQSGGKQLSGSHIANYRLTGNEFVQTLLYSSITEDGKVVHLDQAPRTVTIPVMVSGTRVEFTPAPWVAGSPSPLHVFDGRTLLATAKGEFVDRWEKIDESAAATRLVRYLYVQVEQTKIPDYIRRLREYYQPVQSYRVSQGKMTSWKAYQVDYPNGEAPEYNFVIVMELSGYGQLEADPLFNTTAKQVVGAEKFAQVSASGIGKTIRTETCVVSVATQDWSTANNRVLNVAYLRSLPGKTAELMEIQRNHYGRSTEESVKGGWMASWACMSLRFPEQHDHPYTHMSIAGYDSLAQMEKPASAEHREKWRAANADVMAKLPTVRTRVRGELWRLVEQSTPSGAIKTASLTSNN